MGQKHGMVTPHTYDVVVKKREDILAVEIPPEEQGVLKKQCTGSQTYSELQHSSST